MKDNIFREYDIRGIVGTELLIEESYDLGKAIVTFLKKQDPSLREIVIGKDGRSHSTPICDNLIQAITDLGLDVIDIGLIPTPTMYFSLQHLKKKMGFVVTASHNPKKYNGIKMWGTWGKDIQAIKKIYREKTFAPQAESKGKHLSDASVVEAYVDYLVEDFSHLKNLTINTVFDCGNGSAGIVMPALVKKMGWKNTELLFPEVDGDFPNHEADPTVAKNMTFVKDSLAKSKTLNLGIGFDGDCDRMSPMTKEGVLVPGDKLLAIYAKKVIANNPGAAIVFDIKASSAPMELVKQWGAKPILSPSGHSLIKKAIKDHGALLGGELSCHFFFKDRYFGYDDAIYAGLRLLEIIHEEAKTLTQILEVCPDRVSSPELRIACSSDSEKTKIVDHAKKIFAAKKDIELITIDGIRAHMDYGWGLIRASNTQPVICLRFESTSQEGIDKVKKDFIDALAPYIKPAQLDATE